MWRDKGDASWLDGEFSQRGCDDSQSVLRDICVTHPFNFLVSHFSYLAAIPCDRDVLHDQRRPPSHCLQVSSHVEQRLEELEREMRTEPRSVARERRPDQRGATSDELQEVTLPFTHWLWSFYPTPPWWHLCVLTHSKRIPKKWTRDDRKALWLRKGSIPTLLRDLLIRHNSLIDRKMMKMKFCLQLLNRLKFFSAKKHDI